MFVKDFPGGSDGKVSAYNVGDPGLIPGSGRSSGEGNGKPLQYSCLENPLDRGALQAIGHRVQRVRHKFGVSFLQAAGLQFLSLLDYSPW